MRRRQWPYVARTVHDNEFSACDVSSFGRADFSGKKSPILSSMVNFITILVGRAGAPSSKPC